MQEFYVHSSKQVPTTETLLYSYFVNPNMIEFNILKPIETVADSELHELTPEERGCRFSHENTLVRHREYSYTACIVECRSATMMKLCGCVHPMSQHSSKSIHALISDIHVFRRKV